MYDMLLKLVFMFYWVKLYYLEDSKNNMDSNMEMILYLLI